MLFLRQITPYRRCHRYRRLCRCCRPVLSRSSGCRRSQTMAISYFFQKIFGSFEKSYYLCTMKGNFLPLKRKSSTVIGLANQFSGFFFYAFNFSIKRFLINDGIGLKEARVFYLANTKESAISIVSALNLLLSK